MDRGKWTEETARKEAKKYSCRKEMNDVAPSLYNWIRKHNLYDALSHMPNNQHRFKYTKEQCATEAKKYTYREAFKKGNSKLYESASHNGWLDEICAHMERIYNTHTYEECEAAAKKYNKRNQFNEGPDRKLAAFAKNHGWYEQICAHMPEPKSTPTHHWTFEACREEAKKYNNRTEFEKGNGSAYGRARVMGWLDDICAHMTIQGNRCKRRIYAIEFPDNHAYIGLTYNTERRWARELSNPKETVCKHILNTRLQPVCKIIHDYVDKDTAKRLEGVYEESYRNNGWIILNRAKTGSLGASYSEYTIDECIDAAKKCRDYTEFRHNYPRLYDYCRHHKWLGHIKEILAHEELWNDEELLTIASKYDDYKEFRKKDNNAYQALWRRGLLDEACKDMKKYMRTWSKEECRAEAAKYHTRNEFAKANAAAHAYARSRGWLDEICAHCVNGHAKPWKWTKEKVIEAARTCKTRTEFKRKFQQAWGVARKGGYLEECQSHMKSTSEICREINCKYDKETIFKIASQFARVTDFLNAGYAGAMNHARKYGFWEEVKRHFRK